MKGYNNTEQHFGDHLNAYFIKYKQIYNKKQYFSIEFKSAQFKIKIPF